MQRHGAKRIVVLAVLVALAVAGSFAALGTRPDGIANYYRDNLTPAGFAVWLCGLIVATLSPPFVAIACWFGAGRMRYGWLLHFLLVPATYALVRGAIAIMLKVAGEPDGDSLTGWATDPAAMLMLVCPLVYFVALGSTRLRRRSEQANVR
jgi:hypothetical protein